MKDAVGSLTLARIISFGVLVLAIVVIGVLFFRVMASFFVPLFLAALLVVIFRPLYQAILDRVDGHTHVASILTTVSILLLVLFPAGVIASIAAAQGADFFRHMNSGGLYQSLDQIRSRLSLDLPRAEQFRKLDAVISLLADPDSPEATSDRLDEAEEIAIYLTDVLGGARKVASATGNAEPGQAATEDTDQPIDSQLDQAGEPGTSDVSEPALTTIQNPQTVAFLESLRILRELAGQIATERDQRDPIERQSVREQYQQQYWVVRSAQRDWMRSLIGDSVNSQLKLLANPSDTELKSFFAGAQQYLQPRVLPLTQMAGRFLFQLFHRLWHLDHHTLFFLLLTAPA